jgi:hypothetical protein
MVFHDLSLGDDGDVARKMAVRVPAVGGDQVFPERPARLSYCVTINDPRIVQQNDRWADPLPGHKVSQAKHASAPSSRQILGTS